VSFMDNGVVRETGLMKKIAIIGATGSIGRSALSVIRAHATRFRVTALIGGGNAAALAAQIAEFQPPVAALRDEKAARALARDFPGTKIYGGETGIAECLPASGAEICVSAFGGIAGLLPTLTAMDCGMDIALANKETLVAAGEIVKRRARLRGVKILPVDSEHSALRQCLAGCEISRVRRAIITASGGAFLHWTNLSAVTPAAALNHPTWSMGKKITIDSATLANKALETIEAHFLFDLPYDKIEVWIHPQSVVHGAVEFIDGALVAQLAVPDMRLPILQALSGGEHLPDGVPPLTLAQIANLTFAAPDAEKYPLLRLGLTAGRQGGLAPAVFSAANEAAALAFLAGEIRYPQIAASVEKCLERVPSGEATLENILSADRAAAAFCRAEIERS
jgi:1-deoxy-D-xylulose-5-phosphate reductoisomerase